MGFFASLFASPPATADRLADLCFMIRQERRFLLRYAEQGFESAGDSLRLEFNRDVVMLFLASTIVFTRVHDHQRLMQLNGAVRSRYLSLLPVPATSLVGDCIACDDEFEALGPFIAPGASTPQLRTTPASTTGIMSLVIDYRGPEFRRDLATGISQSKFTSDLWLPVARTVIARIRNVSPDSVPFDHVNHYGVEMVLPFHELAETSKEFLP